MTIEFWKDPSKKQIDPELFSSKAEALAKEIYRERQASRDKANKPTQIRKFYDEVLRFDTIVKANQSEFENRLPYLKMLNAKAAYAMARDLVSPGFKEFISNALKQINSKDDKATFDAFLGFFEAFMGYYKFYDKKKDQLPRGGGR